MPVLTGMDTAGYGSKPRAEGQSQLSGTWMDPGGMVGILPDPGTALTSIYSLCNTFF